MRPGPVPLPTLEEIADHPDIASDLPQPALQTMLYRALAVQQACFTALVANGPSSGVERPSPTQDELVSAGVVAEMMGGISPRAVYRQAREFPFSTFAVRPTPGTVRFRRSLVVEYLRDPDSYRVRHARAGVAVPGAPRLRKPRGPGKAMSGQGSSIREEAEHGAG
jgi:hypothetical protein